MMKKHNILPFSALLLAAILLFSACGSVAMDAEVSIENAYAPLKGSGMSNSYYSDSSSEKAEMEYASDNIVTGGAMEDGQVTQVSDYEEKIIRNVNLSAETREFDRALSEILASVKSYQGYEQSVSTTGRSYHSSSTYCRSANLVLRIPAESLDAFLGEMGGLVNVVSRSTSSDNVTTPYYDIKTRIAVLESEQQAYEEMLKSSEDIKYLLEIKDRLYDVIEEIESYKTQLRMYDNKVAYSTVTVRLNEVVEYSSLVTPKDTFGTKIKNAFVSSWRGFADGFQSFTVWLVYALPTILVLATVGGGIAAVIVAARRAKAKKKQTQKKD